MEEKMGIKEKIANAKRTDWVTEGISEAEIKTTIELAKISAKIEKCRLDLGMTQIEFADYMGVTQGMVSKWESREYNFTIRSLNEICEKLGITLSLEMEHVSPKHDYGLVKWDEERYVTKIKRNTWVKKYVSEEAIA